MSSNSKSLQVIEKLRLEKFYLKKEIAYEHKRYDDLKNAFIELRQETKDKHLDYHEKDKLELVEDKLALQSTISTLTNEIESLSVKNEQFLTDLQSKEFYSDYQRVSEELKNLKEAHALLINMFKEDGNNISRDINLGQDESKDASFIADMLYGNKSNVSSINPKSKVGPLQEIEVPQNTGRNNGLSSIFSCNGFNGMMANGKIAESEIDLKTDRNIKNNVEFLARKLENVDVNFMKRGSP